MLQEPYTFEKARVVLREMADQMALDLVEKNLVTNQLVLTVGYDRESLQNPNVHYQGEVTTDRYGRSVPKHAHGTQNLERYTSSSKMLMDAATALYERVVKQELLVRRMYLTATHVIDEGEAPQPGALEQMDLFTDYRALEQQRKEENQELSREHQRQKAVLEIKKKFGKNAILKGISFTEGATGRERNGQVGGHKA